MNSSIKARLTVLQRIAAQKRSGVAIMALQEDGTWTACKGPQSPEKCSRRSGKRRRICQNARISLSSIFE